MKAKFFPSDHGPQILGTQRGELRPVPDNTPDATEGISLSSLAAALGVKTVKVKPQVSMRFFFHPAGRWQMPAPAQGQPPHPCNGRGALAPYVGPGALLGDSEEAILAAHGITPVENFTPPPPVPQSITASQLRRQLFADGKVTSPVECAEVLAAIAQLPAPANLEAAAQFEYETVFRRAHPLVIQLAAAVGYDTPEKLDVFFRNAAQI